MSTKRILYLLLKVTSLFMSLEATSAAKNQGANNPTNTVFDAKRLIGRKFSDPAIQEDLKTFPFAVKPAAGGKPVVEVQEDALTEEELWESPSVASYTEGSITMDSTDESWEAQL